MHTMDTHPKDGLLYAELDIKYRMPGSLDNKGKTEVPRVRQGMYSTVTIPDQVS